MTQAALRLVVGPLSWLAALWHGRPVEYLVRLDDRVLADLGISRAEIAALKL
jgi:uncharacterized protein YjiS (DUF1127 family)